MHPRPLGRASLFLLGVAIILSAILIAAASLPGDGAPVAEAKREDKAPKQNGKSDKKPAVAAPTTPAPSVTTTDAVARPAAKGKKATNSRGATNAPGQLKKRTVRPTTTEPPATTTTPPATVSTTPTAAPPAAPTTSAERAQSRTRRRAARRAARRTASRTGGSTRAASTPAATPTTLAATVPAAATDDEKERASRRKGEDAKDDEPRTVTRTVRDIVEVVPGPLKVALAALALLSAVLAVGYLVTAMRARSLARQRADLLQDVGLLQTALLPPVPAVVGALRTSVAYRPSEGPGAGGDFYDALTLPEGRSAFILGDVCGHGRQALARTAFMRYTLRAYLEAGLEPSQALQVAGPVIDDHLGGNFATVVLAVHDPKSGSLTYACAGHPAPIVVGPDRPEPVLAAASPPMGLSLRTGVRQTTVPLPPGSVVCLYTDGLAEARTAKGILGRPRLADIVEELGRDATAAAIIDRVAAEARLVTDDMATVVLSPTAGVTTGGFREERLEVNEAEAADGMADRFLKACGVDKERRITAVAEAQAYAGSYAVAVLRVRFGAKGLIVEVEPRNIESLGAATRSRVLA